MSTRRGACVARARLQAKFGNPMPTKTTSPSRSSWAARTAMSSLFVYAAALETVVHPRTDKRLRAQAFAPVITQLFHVAGAVRDTKDKIVQPRGERRLVTRNVFPVDIEVVVAIVVALCIRRMRTPWFADNRVDDNARDKRAVGIGAHDFLVDDLFDDNDDPPGRERGFLLHAIQSPDLRVAAAVRTLCVDDRDIRVERWHRCDHFARVRADHAANLVVDYRQLAALIVAQRPERQLGCA